MIEIRVTFHGKEVIHQLDGVQTVLGRSRSVDIPLPTGTIGHAHAMLTERDGRLWVKDLQSTNGTTIDGKRIRRARIEVGQRFVLADNAVVDVLRHEPTIAPDFELTEARFLEPLSHDPDEDALRVVYGDHLEERGELLRAAWLRAELALRHAPPGEQRLGLVDVYREVDRRLVTAERWRMLVGRPEIEDCPRGRACSARWGKLPRVATEADAEVPVRTCDVCHEPVVHRSPLQSSAPSRTPVIVAIDRLGR